MYRQSRIFEDLDQVSLEFPTLDFNTPVFNFSTSDASLSVLAPQNWTIIYLVILTARKRFSDEDVIRLLREVEIEPALGVSVAEAYRSTGSVNRPTYGWREKFGGMGPSKVKRMKELRRGTKVYIKRCQVSNSINLFSRRALII